MATRKKEVGQEETLGQPMADASTKGNGRAASKKKKKPAGQPEAVSSKKRRPTGKPEATAPKRRAPVASRPANDKVAVVSPPAAERETTTAADPLAPIDRGQAEAWLRTQLGDGKPLPPLPEWATKFYPRQWKGSGIPRGIFAGDDELGKLDQGWASDQAGRYMGGFVEVPGTGDGIRKVLIFS